MTGEQFRKSVNCLIRVRTRRGKQQSLAPYGTQSHQSKDAAGVLDAIVLLDRYLGAESLGGGNQRGANAQVKTAGIGKPHNAANDPCLSTALASLRSSPYLVANCVHY